MSRNRWTVQVLDPIPGHDADTTSWFTPGMWPKCTCGLDPRDNDVLNQHWRENGFKVVDQDGHLVSTPVWRDVHDGTHVTPAAHAFMALRDAGATVRWLLNGRTFAFAPTPEPEPDRPALPYKEDR